MSLTLHSLNAKLLFCLYLTLFQHHFTLASPNHNGVTLRAVLDDSPNSPLYLIENLTKNERIKRLIKVTNARADYLNLVKVNPDHIRVPVVREHLFYAVEFRIGSLQHRVKLLMDTGGGLTWTQCLPCHNCFPQHLPIYDSRYSSTLRHLPCGHPLCHGTGKPFTCVNNVCIYTIHYGGGAVSSGVASMDVFHFPTGSFYVVYGCSVDTYNVFFQNTDISGVFGLSMSPESMTSQFNPPRFSYCLVPFRDAIPRPLVLRFGVDVQTLPPQEVQTTKFTTRPGIPYFYLQLLDITVADHRIGFAPYTFQVRPNGQGGCIIDSGALYSIIDTQTLGVNAYEAVLDVFEAYYGSRGLKKTEEEDKEGFDLCYKLPEHYHNFASMTFHLNGADYYVDGRYMNVFRPGSFCVAILGSDLGSFIGAWQQQNKRIIHNLNIGGLQFADEQCINDHVA